MNEKNVDPLMTANHRRLFRIASIANIFVWVVLGVNLLLVIWEVVAMQNVMYGAQAPNLLEYFGQDWVNAINILLRWLNNLMRGVVAALVLKAVAVGLNMLVETDWNYRSAAQGVSHE